MVISWHVVGLPVVQSFNSKMEVSIAFIVRFEHDSGW